MKIDAEVLSDVISDTIIELNELAKVLGSGDNHHQEALIAQLTGNLLLCEILKELREAKSHAAIPIVVAPPSAIGPNN